MSSNASLSTKDNDDIIINNINFVLYTVTVVLGITGNAVVIWMAGIKLKPAVNNVWLVNLAIADLIFCFTRIFSIIQMKLERWPFGLFLCQFHGLFKHTNMFCSVFLLAVISLDRVLCVRQPILMKRRRTLFAARVVAVCVWIIALLFSIPFFTFRKIYMDNNNQTKCKMVWVEKPKENKNTKVALYSMQFIFSFIFPFMVILICYILVGLGLRRTRLSGKSRPLRILVCLVIAFFLCWAPYQCLLLVDMVYNENKVVKKWYSITKSIAYFNSCVNPVLYFCMGLKVKEGFRQKLMRVYKRALRDDMDGQMAQPTDPSLD
ncbi:formyl peptide receptor 2-like [Simochromis diagramma]|uniref:formyl peptide receptor 2-like n=1 Tax=Simochromis diagramma TaxID=43689 RepID=UPI001A7E9FB3|nr:formyl peptide receptor 2-like [Simochromis diagramma]